jgi:hypothetical protein
MKIGEKLLEVNITKNRRWISLDKSIMKDMKGHYKVPISKDCFPKRLVCIEKNPPKGEKPEVYIVEELDDVKGGKLSRKPRSAKDFIIKVNNIISV